MEWVEPELFMEHDGKEVYHAYKDQDSGHRLEFWFNTSLAEDDEYEFDVRNLPGYEPGCDIKQVIRDAIDKGVIKFEEE
jgi:hypothetical protein